MASSSVLIFYAFLAVAGQVGVNVALPLFVNSLMPGADPYFVLAYGATWFTIVFFICLAWEHCFYPARVDKAHTSEAITHFQMFLIGGTTSLNGVLVIFASPTDRTPAFLQALLVNFSIPMTIGFRWLILRKSSSLKQWLCAGSVMIGIFVALIPSIIPSLTQSGAGDPKAAKESGIGRVLWPMCFMLGFVPAAIFTVLQEKGLKVDDTDTSGGAGAGGNAPKAVLAALLAEEGAGLTPTKAGEVNSFGAVTTTAATGGGGGGSGPRSAGIGSMDLEVHNSTGPSSYDNWGSSKQGSRSGSRRRLSRPKQVSSSLAFGAVAMEAEQGKEEVDLIYFLAYTNLYQVLVNYALFWTDILPSFGMATGATFFSRFGYGLACVWGAGAPDSSPDCQDGSAALRAAIFVCVYLISQAGGGLLLRASEGATYLALVQTLTTPIAALFWTLFNPQPLEWHPAFTVTTAFSLAGLVLMAPGIVGYHKFSEKPAAH